MELPELLAVQELQDSECKERQVQLVVVDLEAPLVHKVHRDLWDQLAGLGVKATQVIVYYNVYVIILHQQAVITTAITVTATNVRSLTTVHVAPCGIVSTLNYVVT